MELDLNNKNEVSEKDFIRPSVLRKMQKLSDQGIAVELSGFRVVKSRTHLDKDGSLFPNYVCSFKIVNSNDPSESFYSVNSQVRFEKNRTVFRTNMQNDLRRTLVDTYDETYQVLPSEYIYYLETKVGSKIGETVIVGAHVLMPNNPIHESGDAVKKLTNNAVWKKFYDGKIGLEEFNAYISSKLPNPNNLDERE